MFKSFKSILKVTSQVIRSCESELKITNDNLKRFVLSEPSRFPQKLCFHTASPCNASNSHMDEISKRKSGKEAADRHMISSRGSLLETGQSLKRYEEYFSTADLPYKLFEGVPFKDIPIVYINSSRNNTKLGLADKGQIQVNRTCGCDGFKNTRKGTNIAAQTTGVAFALRAIKKGYKTVRIVLKGFGPGRMSAMKGLELGGLTMISITDNTIDYSPLRPRKQRRL